MNHDQPGDTVRIDVRLSSARSEDYVALVLPGGVANPDSLRLEPAAVAFVRSFFDRDKPVASICHGPWMLVEAIDFNRSLGDCVVRSSARRGIKRRRTTRNPGLPSIRRYDSA